MAEYEDDFEDYKDDDFDEEPPAPAPAPAPPRAAPAASRVPLRAPAAAPVPAPPAENYTGRLRVGGSAPVAPRQPPPRPKVATAAGGIRTQVALMLDSDAYQEIFALAPASAFEQLQEKVRLGAWRHASAQAPVEVASTGTQVERGSSVVVGVQVPDDLGVATKTPAAIAAASANAGGGGAPAFESRGVAFLRSAGRIIEAICEANLAAAVRGSAAAKQRQQQHSPRPTAVASAAVAAVLRLQLPDLPLLAGRAVLCAALSPLTPHTRVVVFGPMPAADAAAVGVDFGYASASLLVVLERRSVPAAVLTTYADVTSVAFSPDASMIVAGTAEGAISCFDLTEAVWLHPTEYGRMPSSSSSSSTSEAAAAAAAVPLVWPQGLRAASYSTHAPALAAAGASAAAAAAANISGLVSAVRSVIPAVHIAPDAGWLDGAAEQQHAQAQDAAAAGGGDGGGALYSAAQRAPRRVAPVFGAGFGSLLIDSTGELAALSAPQGDEDGGGRDDADAGRAAGALEHASGRTFQFMSLDDRGNVDAWFAVNLGLDVGNDKGGPASSALVDLQDFGRSVSSSVKLIRAGGLPSVTRTAHPAAPAAAGAPAVPLIGPQACCMSLCPSDPGRMLIGTEDGRVLQVTRSGDRPVPGAFALSDDALHQAADASAADDAPQPAADDSVLETGSARAAAATSVAFHPLVPTLFVAGFADGRVGLFTTAHALPLLVWPAPWTRAAAGSSSGPPQRSVVPVVRVAWVPGRPAAFVAVDADGWLGAWDLLASTATAFSSVRLLAEGSDAVSVDVCGATVLAQTAVTVLVASPAGVVEAALHADFIAPRAGEMRALRALVSRKHL